MKNSLSIVFILVAALAANASTAFCQQPGSASKPADTAKADSHALKIRHQLESIGYGRNVTVKLRHGSDYHGRIVDTGDDSFRIDEVDLHKVMNVSYSDTKRIDTGYREKSLIGNSRPNPHSSRIIAIAAIGGIMAMIGAVMIKGR